jgi:hypothetical protein
MRDPRAVAEDEGARRGMEGERRGDRGCGMSGCAEDGRRRMKVRAAGWKVSAAGIAAAG